MDRKVRRVLLATQKETMALWMEGQYKLTATRWAFKFRELLLGAPLPYPIYNRIGLFN
jgi:hypothetical protein